MRSATEDEWDALVRDCPQATYFHSRAFAGWWSGRPAGALRPDPVLVTFDDGRRALLPVSLEVGPGGEVRRALSSPAGTYGGWVSGDDLGPAHLRSLSDLLRTRWPALTWRANPFDAGQLAMAGDGEPDATHALRLAGGFDEVLRGLSKGHRAAERQARRLGVEVRPAVREDDWRAYFRVYEDSLARWGDAATSRYDWALFRSLAGRRDQGVRLWLAERGGELMAGALCLSAARHVVYWHGAALARGMSFRPVHALLLDAIRDACERGFEWFDMNPSGGHEGVAAFKSHFGAQRLASPVVRVGPRRSLRERWRRALASAG